MSYYKNVHLVKVVSCSKSTYWYNDCINQEFWVEDLTWNGQFRYKVIFSCKDNIVPDNPGGFVPDDVVLIRTNTSINIEEKISYTLTELDTLYIVVTTTTSGTLCELTRTRNKDEATRILNQSPHHNNLITVSKNEFDI
jgi:hypothetical protein